MIGYCRCGLGERSGVVLLHMLEEKPGLEVDALLGNPLGEEVEKKVRYYFCTVVTLCDWLHRAIYMCVFFC